jgi:3-methyladenine DNA glycosylase AlkC
MKNLLGKELLERINLSFAGVYPGWDPARCRALFVRLKPLELKQRVRLIRDELHDQLPSEYPKALKLLLKSARSGKLSVFDLWPYTDFVQTYGLEHVDLSLEALKELTCLFTGEFAVRPFLIRHRERTLRYLEKCARDPDVDVRRWASEGSRPRLPWGERLQEFVADPELSLKILDTLKFDPELYVRKSVSNHLNDIAKDHPDWVVKTLKRWNKEAGAEHTKKIDWINRRALRTLIKDGHAGALSVLGVSNKVDVELEGFKILRKKIRLGEKLEFEFELRSLSKRPQKLVIDYIVHFMKSNQKTAPKVFKLKMIELAPMGRVAISKSHPVKRITTREYYPGLHALEIQINGSVSGRQEWHLVLL